MTLENVQTVHEYGINEESREIFLFNPTDIQDNSINHVTADNFIKNLTLLDKINKPITIHQYSLGGDWQAGMAIYDAIRSSQCQFLFITYGFAASMGSIIPQAVYGKGLRITQPYCEWIIHEGSLDIGGSNKGVQSRIEANNKNTAQMYDIYSNVCKDGVFFKGESISKIKSYLRRKLTAKEDWWISAQEAVDYGFADIVIGSKGYENIKKIKLK